MAETLHISRLGRHGDGIAELATGDVFVPLTLPGETIYAEIGDGRATLIDIPSPSAQRVEPSCPHFGNCGGCALQHMAMPAYLAWKRETVAAALAQRGLEADVRPVVAIAAGSRRRAVMGARRAGGRLLLGYHARHSNALVPVGACPVLVPEIERALPALARWLGPLIGQRGESRLTVTATDTGLDVTLATARGRPPADAVAAVVRAGAEVAGIARLTVDGETVMAQTWPVIDIGGTAVVPPPGAFVQAVADAEAAMADLAVAGVAGARRVADLFAGIGTFALRIARGAEVLAVESDAAALDALTRAARAASGLKPVAALRRDLARMPVSAGELARFDAVVFDPPRAGARAQAAEIARSAVKRVVAVSCNPATLARDLRTLVDGGYRIADVTPVDQFLFAPHIEVVARLERG